MMHPIRFYAHGTPKGQPRPRAFARNGRAGVYDPATAEGWKGQIAIAAKAFIPAEPIDAPVYLRLEFYFPRPKSHYRTGKRAKELRDDAPGYHTGKPDFDNCAKAVADALTTLRFWTDDALVVDSRIRKLYDDGRGPGCIIEIQEANP